MRSPLILATGALVLTGALAACGDGSTSRSEFVKQLNDDCVTQAAYSVWMPAHMADYDLSVDEASKELEEKLAPLRKQEDDLEPPDELRSAAADVKRLAADLPQSRGKAEMASSLQDLADAYDRLGATTCRDIARANVLSLDGSTSIRAAYAKYGVPFPDRPAEW